MPTTIIVLVAIFLAALGFRLWQLRRDSQNQRRTSEFARTLRRIDRGRLISPNSTGGDTRGTTHLFTHTDRRIAISVSKGQLEVTVPDEQTKSRLWDNLFCGYGYEKIPIHVDPSLPPLVRSI